MAQLFFMDLVTEEFYVVENISAGYGHSVGVKRSMRITQNFSLNFFPLYNFWWSVGIVQLITNSINQIFSVFRRYRK